MTSFQCIQNDTLSLSLCHHQSDIVSCYGKRYEKRYVNDGDKRYRNDATKIDYFLPGQSLRAVLQVTLSECRGVPRIWEGGGARILFFRFGNLHVAKRHAAHGEAMRNARGDSGYVIVIALGIFFGKTCHNSCVLVYI